MCTWPPLVIVDDELRAGTRSMFQLVPLTRNNYVACCTPTANCSRTFSSHKSFSTFWCSQIPFYCCALNYSDIWRIIFSPTIIDRDRERYRQSQMKCPTRIGPPIENTISMPNPGTVKICETRVNTWFSCPYIGLHNHLCKIFWACRNIILRCAWQTREHFWFIQSTVFLQDDKWSS